MSTINSTPFQRGVSFSGEAQLRADFADLRCLDWKFNSSFFNKVILEQDFRGVIYAPFSKVIVKGSGKIEGFILAHELAFVGNADSGRTQETLKDYALPVLMPVRVEGSENRVWNYQTISDPPRDYKIVYNTFKTYTDVQ